MDGHDIGVRITFDQLTPAEANRAAQELRQAIIERVGDDVTATIERDSLESQDAGQLLLLWFGTASAELIARSIRAYLARRSDRNQITITTADGTQVIITGDGARNVDAAALMRAVRTATGRRHRILFLAANPADTKQLALDTECRDIEHELRMAPHRDDFELCSKWAVTIDDLARHLMELEPTIVHFSGHGARPGDVPAPAPDTREILPLTGAPTGTSGIYLHADRGGPAIVPARALAMMIKSSSPTTRVVVLNACYGDAQAEELRRVVDCVVGMTGAIADRAARIFAVGLYRALGNRRSIGDAVAHAVATLAAYNLPDEQLPRCRPRDGLDAQALIL